MKTATIFDLGKRVVVESTDVLNGAKGTIIEMDAIKECALVHWESDGKGWMKLSKLRVDEIELKPVAPYEEIYITPIVDGKKKRRRKAKAVQTSPGVYEVKYKK